MRPSRIYEKGTWYVARYRVFKGNVITGKCFPHITYLPSKIIDFCHILDHSYFQKFCKVDLKTKKLILLIGKLPFLSTCNYFMWVLLVCCVYDNTDILIKGKH